MSNKQYTLKDLLTIKNGRDYKELSNGNIPVYGTGGIMTYVDDFLYDGESILLPRKGTLSNICYVNEKFWTVDTMYWTIVNEDLAYPKFLYCYLSLLDLSRRDSGSTLPSMTFDSYYSIPINLPSMKVQKLIGNFIFKLNEKIENNNKINSELESMAKTIYDYWFLQFEFPNEEGKPYKSSGGKMVWNEELKREIPEGWKSVSLGKLFDFVKGKIPAEISKIKTNEFDTAYLTIDAVNSGEIQYCNSSEMIITNGDVLMVMDGAASSEVYVGKKGAIGSTFCKLQLKNSYVSNELLYLVLKKYEQIFKKINTGSTVPHANKNYINDSKICLPEDSNLLTKLQNNIIVYINKLIRNINENEELASLRDFLLPLLMNGQVEFKDNINEDIEHKEVEEIEFSHI